MTEDEREKRDNKEMEQKERTMWGEENVAGEKSNGRKEYEEKRKRKW